MHYYCQLVWLYSVLIFKWHLFYFAKPSMHHQLYCSLESTATRTYVFQSIYCKEDWVFSFRKKSFNQISDLKRDQIHNIVNRILQDRKESVNEAWCRSILNSRKRQKHKWAISLYTVTLTVRYAAV